MIEEKPQSISGLAETSMLRMAGAWQSLGQINQAIGVYLRILRGHPASREAKEARERLLELAASFERKGQFHLAMDLYERTERACR